ncbi:hypothetical protein AB0L00_42660 [Actinoallomurus sp. NPDC052308]|uniref:hypothetical protein n=1 Tax=Actinoallomurus sp. NPDC052308 TaxID=3155530 RepID=UPI003420C1BE
MKDYQDRTDERARPMPGDRPVAGMPMTGADEGRGRTADRTEDHDTEPNKIILSSRTEDDAREATGSGRDGTRESRIEPGSPADPLGERTAGPTATARSYAPGSSPAGSTGSAPTDAGPADDGVGPAPWTAPARADDERPPADSPGVAVAADGPDPATVAGESGTSLPAGSGADAVAEGTAPDIPAGETAGERFFGRDDADRFDSRWREVKAGFVDDPRASVERAGTLCEEAVTALTTALEDQQRGLRERWNGDADTERLRTALRAYGDLLGRLTSL